jgi:hypothetical protein
MVRHDSVQTGVHRLWQFSRLRYGWLGVPLLHGKRKRSDRLPEHVCRSPRSVSAHDIERPLHGDGVKKHVRRQDECIYHQGLCPGTVYLTEIPYSAGMMGSW